MGFFATHVVPTVLYVLKKLTFPLSLFAMLAPAPQDVVDKNVDAMAAAANKSQARLPRALNQMVGTWKLQEKINVDQFMAGLGIKGPLRAALRLAGQQQELLADTGALTIVTSDLRGRSALKLPLNGRGVVAHDGDGGAAVRRSAYVQKDAVVVTETLVGESQPLSTCRRTLQRDGRMRIDISKRTPDGKTVAMAAIASRAARPAPSLVTQC
jgi:hypothetical protein